MTHRAPRIDSFDRPSRALTRTRFFCTCDSSGSKDEDVRRTGRQRRPNDRDRRCRPLVGEGREEGGATERRTAVADRRVQLGSVGRDLHRPQPGGSCRFLCFAHLTANYYDRLRRSIARSHACEHSGRVFAQPRRRKRAFVRFFSATNSCANVRASSGDERSGHFFSSPFFLVVTRALNRPFFRL